MAKMLLYGSLLCMVGGVLVLAYSKTIKVDAPMTEAVAEVATAIETFRSCGIEGVNADVDFDPSFDRRGA
jgi:hypothetical protein